MPLIEPGTKLPAFTLPDQHGEKIAFKDLLGAPLILYFYPKADTSGCTKEACAFNEALPQLSKLQSRVVGISPDTPDRLAKFAQKYDLRFTLLGDVPGPDKHPATLVKLGVWCEKSMYGRKYMGVIRTTYLLDARGTVARRWDNVKVPGHAQEVLEALRMLEQ